MTLAATSCPGDDLVPDATIVIDRHLEFPAPPDRVWPWLAQLGKSRGGWYLPRRVERLIPRRYRATRQLLPQYQQLAVGMVVPDWGPGDPVFRVTHLEPGRALVYLSLRDRSDRHRWPADNTRRAGVLALSWALHLADTPTGGTHLHIRLRLAPAGTRFRRVVAIGGGFVDWLTIVGLNRGLAERLAAADQINGRAR